MADQLTDQLTNADPNEFLDTDERWRTFIIDYKDYIRERSQYDYVSNEIMVVYKMDVQRFLSQHYHLDNNLYWIFYIINDIKSEIEMNLADYYGQYFYVPDFETIRNLRQLFVNTVGQQIVTKL